MYISKITLQNTAGNPNTKFHKNNVRKVTQQNPANVKLSRLSRSFITLKIEGLVLSFKHYILKL